MTKLTKKQIVRGISCEIGEFLIVILAGMWMRIPLEFILLTLLAFVIPRLTIKRAMHYKAQRLCFVWTVVVYMSMVVIAHAGVVLSVFMAAFCALILSGHANIEDATQFAWKPKGQAKYQKEFDYIKYNPMCPDLIAFESRLKAESDNLTLMCYKLIFKDGVSWERAANELKTETQRLTPVVDKIAFGLRLCCPKMPSE